MRLDPRKLELDLRTVGPGMSRGVFTLVLEEVDWNIEEVEPLPETGTLSVTVDIRKDSVIVTGELIARFRTSCARCLGTVIFSVGESMFREYSFGFDGSADDDIEKVSDDGGLPLLDAVREAVILSIPGKPLCSPDCPGMSYI